MQDINSLKYYKLKDNFNNIKSIKLLEKRNKVYELKIFLLSLIFFIFLFSTPFIFGILPFEPSVIISKTIICLSFSIFFMFIWLNGIKYYKIEYKNGTVKTYAVFHKKEIDLLN